MDKIKEGVRSRTKRYASQGNQYAKDILAVIEDHDRLQDALQGATVIANHAGERIRELESDKQKLVEGLQTIRRATESGSDYEIKLTAIGIKCDSLLKDWEGTEHAEPSCRSCGCTWSMGCPGGCYWVEADLCSACSE